MTVELACLVANALWGFLLVVVEIFGKTRVAGVAWNAGNRDVEPTFPDWIHRTGRALGNHKENFPLFLTAIVAVLLAHRTDTVTAVAAIAYVVLRAGHALLYIAGVEGWRSRVFTLSIVAVLVIFARLVRF